VMRQAIADQRRIELVRFAIDVEISAREMGIKKRCAEARREVEQLLDIGVLGSPQRHGVELRGGKKASRIDAPAMGGVEDKGGGELGRSRHLERRIELGLDRLRLCAAHAIPRYKCARDHSWLDSLINSANPGLFCPGGSRLVRAGNRRNDLGLAG